MGRQPETTDQRPWAVLVHNDEVNTIPGVMYVLHRVCGIAPERGLQAAVHIDSAGFLEVAHCATELDAQDCAAELQLYGLNATVWRP